MLSPDMNARRFISSKPTTVDLSIHALALAPHYASVALVQDLKHPQILFAATSPWEAVRWSKDIVHTTQFFEAFPILSGSALTTQANATEIAFQEATGVIGTIAMELSNNAMAQVIKAGLLDDGFLLDISLQL